MPDDKIDFYKSKEKFEKQASKVREWCKTEGNKRQIERFLNWMQARDLSYSRRLKYLVNWLDKVDKEDIILIIGKINSHE